MRKSSWNEFVGKYPENPQDAFEALSRLLFRTRFGIADSLPYFYNNAGDETVPVTVKKDIIGFQSKFFSGDTIDDQQATQIKHSIQTAHTHYPNQNKIIVYTNLSFGNPKPGETMTARQKDIEKTAADNSLSIEWMFGDNILDLVDKTPLARALFFDLSDNLQRLPSSIRKWNELNFKTISSQIPYNGQTIKINRSKEIAEVKELLAQGKHVFIYGESGSGKSAVVKQHWEEHGQDSNVAYLMLKGIDFDTRSVNDLFNFDESFTYMGFRDFFAGHNRKILVIDSAEQLVEIGNRTVLRLLLDGLSDCGWQFIFTCKSNTYDELYQLLNELALTVSDIKVEALTKDNLQNVANQMKITLPSHPKVLSQIKIPFYLARYCELNSADIVSPESFRELVWNYKVRGLVRGGIQLMREECLLQIVEFQQQQQTYFVNPKGINHEVAYILVQEDVLVMAPHKGYAVKHDLYVDWSLDYLLEREIDTEEKCLAFLNVAPESITVVNAFSRWLANIIDADAPQVNTIVNAYLSGQVNKKWEHCLLTIIGLSEIFASRFFSKYDFALKENNYALFEKFVNVIDVSCKTVSQYIEYKGERYPIYKPIGKGWDEAINFVYANKDAYYLDHLGTVQKLLNGYSKAGNKAQAMEQAAQLSLLLHEIIAQKRIHKEEIWTAHMKAWSELVGTYAWGIRKELKVIFKKVVDNRWVKHQDPYFELVEYVLKDEDNIGKVMLYMSCYEEVLDLLRLFWQEQPEALKEIRRYRHSSFGREYVFALNEEFGMDMAYFPASPFQTPVGSLLSAESLVDPNGKKTLDFIIDFTNECVKAYSERDTLDYKICIPVEMPDGSSHEVISSQSLWNLYRGTQSYTVPHVLESIHMALEAKLLSDIDNKQQDTYWERVKEWISLILNRSNSASLYSIVASIVVAHPVELFDELLIICQDIRFLSFDLTRYSCEITADHKSFTFRRHEAWYKERKQSNSLPHRQKYLERTLLEMQYKYDNENSDIAKARLAKVYDLVDKLRAQADALSSENRTLLFIKERINYRGYKKEDVSLENGLKAVMLTPTFPTDLQEENEMVTSFAKRMGAMELRVWAKKKFNGEENDLKGNAFVNNPQLALKIIRDIENQTENSKGDQLLLPGDEYVPYMSSAVLLMCCQDVLDDVSKNECWERIMTALKNPHAMISNTLSEFNMCITSIPTLLEVYPERANELLPIITRYTTIKDIYVNQRVCDILSSVILSGELWMKYPFLMYQALEMLKQDLPNQDYVAMDAESADSILCLLTYKPLTKARHIGSTCISKLSAKWKDDKGYDSLMEKHYVADNVTNYILSAPLEDVDGLIAQYVPLLTRDSYGSESILESFILSAAQMGRYDNFWKVWNAYYDRVREVTDGYHHNPVLEIYLLNPNYLSRDFDDWFRIEDKDIVFFERVATDMGGDPIVLPSISRVFATIGKPYVKQSIEVFYIIVSRYQPRLGERKGSVMYYLEKIIKKVLVENDTDIRTDVQFKGKVLRVLEYMRDNGSTEASEMMKIL